MDVRIDRDTLYVGHVQITFQRTLRIPDDGRDHPLPPGLGAFPLRRVADHAERVPPQWRAHGGILLPMYQREAMWLSFGGRWWKPNALKVGVGKVNAISGAPWDEHLHDQDYVVVPLQRWLDGINSGSATIRQFVAMPLGAGYSVEAQVTGAELHGGLQLCVFDSQPGRFPDAPPRPDITRLRAGNGGAGTLAMASAAGAMRGGGAAMGLGAGGTMRQRIHPDPHGVDAWDASSSARVFVHLCNAQQWREITGEEPPPTPVTARAYASHGLPWFDRYDEALGDVAPATALEAVESVKQRDAAHGFDPQQDDDPIEAPRVVDLPVDVVADGRW